MVELCAKKRGQRRAGGRERERTGHLEPPRSERERLVDLAPLIELRHERLRGQSTAKGRGQRTPSREETNGAY